MRRHGKESHLPRAHVQQPSDPCCPSAMGAVLSLHNPTSPEGSDLLAERSSGMTNFLHTPVNKHPGSGTDPENVASVAAVTPLDVVFEGRRESPWEGAFLMP